MGDQTVYDLVLCALVAYVALGLCFIGRPSLALPILRWIHAVITSCASGKVTSPKGLVSADIRKHS